MPPDPLIVDEPDQSGSSTPRSAVLDNPLSPVAPEYAPFRTYPKSSYASIEYPGTVSHPSALLKLIHQDDINECFNAPATENKILEMRYRPEDMYGIPVRGMKVPSQKLLLRVVKRKRKVKDGAAGANGTGGDGKGKGKQREGAEEGIFHAEIVGPLTQTVRFRSMADWHYTPDPNGRVAQIVGALKDLDYDAILEYNVPPLDETFREPVTPPLEDAEMDGLADGETQFRSTLDLQPLPVFSDRRLPMIWNYRNHNQAVIEEYEDRRTGEIKKRFVNRSRFVAFSVPSIGQGGKTPNEPVKNLKDKLDKLDPRIMAKLRALLEERPVWLRHSLLRQFSESDRHVIITHKSYLPAVVYTFGAGPFWKCLCRYGYDPRQDASSRKFQRIYFYLHVNRPGPRGPAYRTPEPDEDDDDAAGTRSKARTAWETEQERLATEGKRPPMDKSKDYFFDGQYLHRDLPDFQLCDITDPLIQKYIGDPNVISNKCTSSNGWYKPSALNLIKLLTRLKYSYIKDNNKPAPNDICFQAIEEYERALVQGLDADEGDQLDGDEEKAEGDDGEMDDDQDVDGEAGGDGDVNMDDD